MKKRIILFLLASFITLLTAHNTFAGNRAGAFTFTPGAAYDFWASKRNLNNTWLIPSLAFGYDFTDNWGIEGSWGTFGTSQTRAGGGNTAKGDLYTVDGLYHFGDFHRFEPYISAGVGAYHINPNGTSAVNQANINAGLGTQLFFGDSIALRGEVRDLYTMSGGKNDVVLGFGVSFLVGGETPAPEPMVVYKN